jgi:hypothetical protein
VADGSRNQRRRTAPAGHGEASRPREDDPHIKLDGPARRLFSDDELRPLATMLQRSLANEEVRSSRRPVPSNGPDPFSSGDASLACSLRKSALRGSRASLSGGPRPTPAGPTVDAPTARKERPRMPAPRYPCNRKSRPPPAMVMGPRSGCSTPLRGKGAGGVFVVRASCDGLDVASVVERARRSLSRRSRRARSAAASPARYRRVRSSRGGIGPAARWRSARAGCRGG